MVTPVDDYSWTEKFLEEALLSLEIDEPPIPPIPESMAPLNGSIIALNSTPMTVESEEDLTSFNALPQSEYPFDSVFDSFFRAFKFVA